MGRQCNIDGFYEHLHLWQLAALQDAVGISVLVAYAKTLKKMRSQEEMNKKKAAMCEKKWQSIDITILSMSLLRLVKRQRTVKANTLTALRVRA